MRSSTCCVLLSLAVMTLHPNIADAGMPGITLTEVAQLRLRSLSFFLVGFLLCAWLIQLLWNYLRMDFTILPRLSYGKALGLTTLWGLVFVLVLTMISGARELMTPGAWEKKGWTYELAKDDATTASEVVTYLSRQLQLDRLRTELWRHARANDGQFPADRDAAKIPAETWRVPGLSQLNYAYVGGRKIDEPMPLAFEPDIFGPKRLVLFANGEVKSMAWDEIAQLLNVEKR